MQRSLEGLFTTRSVSEGLPLGIVEPNPRLPSLTLRVGI